MAILIFAEDSLMHLMNTITNEITFANGYKENEEIDRLIELRDKAKKKRIRKKFNKRINFLINVK